MLSKEDSQHIATEYADLLGSNGRLKQRRAEQELVRRRVEEERRRTAELKKEAECQAQLEQEWRERQQHLRAEHHQAEEDKRRRRREQMLIDQAKRRAERDAWHQHEQELEERRLRKEERCRVEEEQRRLAEASAEAERRRLRAVRWQSRAEERGLSRPAPGCQVSPLPSPIAAPAFSLVVADKALQTPPQSSRVALPDHRCQSLVADQRDPQSLEGEES